MITLAFAIEATGASTAMPKLGTYVHTWHGAYGLYIVVAYIVVAKLGAYANEKPHVHACVYAHASEHVHTLPMHMPARTHRGWWL